MSESGLSVLEGVTARVTSWRRRHRGKQNEVRSYQVVFDGATLADIEARTAQGLDDELGAAAWEVAQGISRPATVDVIALGENGIEIARLPMRVMPAATAAPPQSADMGTVVKVLLDANQQMMKLCTEMVGAVTSQLKVTAEITTELAKSTAKRAVHAEAEAAAATATALDAVSVAKDAGSEKRDRQERIEDFVEAWLKHKLMGPQDTGNDADKAVGE